MKIKRILTMCIAAVMAVSAMSISAFAIDTSDNRLYENAQSFASRYEYHEGDSDKSIELYPDVVYSSGIETSKSGIQYECPIFYFDKDASYFGQFDLKKGDMGLSINDNTSDYGSQCVLYNGVTLVPVSVFRELGIEVKFDEDLYVTTLSKEGTVLEILPQLKGMRKNQAAGYYVPLETCARFVDDVLYVPFRAIAEEFGISVDWDGNTKTVILKTN